MAVVGRIYRMAAEGLGPQAIQTRLFEEGTPSPTGDVLWSRQTVDRVLWSDLYKAHTHQELSGMVSAEVLARLEEGTEYCAFGGSVGGAPQSTLYLSRMVMAGAATGK
jgi:hypothetical protein